ncbi:MAG: response regulator [Patescibacteria group bacterium]|nr:response regulator [Patescibacteria group bacterium]
MLENLKKVLVIEDEEIIREILQKKIKKEGYEVETAKDGEEGISKIKEIMPDIIILDIVMPKMDGFAVLEEMKKDENIANIPVIIVSNSGQPVEIDKVKEFGVKDWIVKTEFDPQEVINKIKTQL